MKKILFIHTNEFNYISGSSVFFSTIFENNNYNILDLACFGNVNNSKTNNQKQQVLYNSSNKIINKIINNSFLEIFYKYYLYYLWPKKALKKIEKKIDLKTIDLIWVLSSGCSISLVNLLSEKYNIPIHATVHDDIGGFSSIDRLLLNKKMSILLRRAISRDFVSELMIETLIEKYNFSRLNNTVIYPIPNITIPTEPTINKEFKTIAFAGNIWAMDAFIMFYKAIKILNEKRESNKIRFVVYADNISLFIKHNKELVDINFEKILPLDDLMKKLCTFDLLYVPMSFKLNQKNLCETSLPSKIFPYSYSQIPIFAHGPKWGSNVKFVDKHKIGFCSSTTNPIQLAVELARIEEAFVKRKVISENQLRLIKTEFSISARNEKLNEILN